MAKEVIKTLYGRYGVYEIIKNFHPVLLKTDYDIYKDGKYWKTASSPEVAYRIIKKNDPNAS